MERYHVKLPVFEGPFDLLLFFIARDELDIHDIPIAHVTKRFLNYLARARHLNIDLASEFTWTASTLMRFKMKRLLPLSTLEDESAMSEEEFKAKLSRQLIAYQRYKEVSSKLEMLYEARAKKLARGNQMDEVVCFLQKEGLAIEMEEVTLESLVHAYVQAQRRLDTVSDSAEDTYAVSRPAYSVEAQKTFLVQKIETNSGALSLFELLRELHDKRLLIYTFLALLELVQLEQIRCKVGQHTNQCWLSLPLKKSLTGS